MRRALVTAIAILVTHHSLLGAQALAVSDTAGWSWERLYAAPGVDSAEVRWLQTHLVDGNTRELIVLVGRLSKPEAAQLLPRNIALDALRGSSLGRAYSDSFAHRPPDGLAGSVHVAALAAHMRQRIMALTDRPNGVHIKFGATPSISSFVPQPGTNERNARGLRIELSFNTAPAETLLAILSEPGITPAQVLPRIGTPSFDALIAHRGQAFYSLALSRELLAEDLSHAASDAPIDRLYAYANPYGYLHYADVRRNRAEYVALLDTLRAGQALLLSDIAEHLAPYLPDGTHVQRTVSLFFADGADGWGSDGITAMDLEYYKEDLPRFRRVLLHEMFHAAQDAIQRAAAPGPARRLRSPADSMIAEAFTDLLIEGTANYVSARAELTPASARVLAERGAAVLDSLVHLTAQPVFDRDSAQRLLNAGVSQEGLFYWLGSVLSRDIVAARGPQALGTSLQKDGIAFVLEHEGLKPAPSYLLSPAIVDAARRLAGSAQARPKRDSPQR